MTGTGAVPKGLRDRFGIEGWDEVVVRERNGTIVIEKPVSREELAEGYPRRAGRYAELDEGLEGVSREVNEELEGVSREVNEELEGATREANEELGEAPTRE